MILMKSNPRATVSSTYIERNFFEGAIDNSLSLEGRCRLLNARRKDRRRLGEVSGDRRNRSGADQTLQNVGGHFGWKFHFRRKGRRREDVSCEVA